MMKRTGMEIHAQSIIEYAIIIAIVSSALAAMQVYIKRGLQAQIKVTADELGTQDDGFLAEGIDGMTLMSESPINSITNRIAVHLTEEQSSAVAVYKRENLYQESIGARSVSLSDEEAGTDGEFSSSHGTL